MTTPQILLTAVLLFFAYWSCEEAASQKRFKRLYYTDLSFDESYLISMLMQVKPDSIYGHSIYTSLKQLEDGNKLRDLIVQVEQSTIENPAMMKNILGADVFRAVWESIQKKADKAAIV